MAATGTRQHHAIQPGQRPDVQALLKAAPRGLPYGLGALQPGAERGRGRGRAEAGAWPGARRAAPGVTAGLPGAGRLPDQPAVRGGRPGHRVPCAGTFRACARLSAGSQVPVRASRAGMAAAHRVRPAKGLGARRHRQAGRCTAAHGRCRAAGRGVSGHQVLQDPEKRPGRRRPGRPGTHQPLVRAVLTVTGPAGLPPADCTQIALQLTRHAQVVAGGVEPLAGQLPGADGPRLFGGGRPAGGAEAAGRVAGVGPAACAGPGPDSGAACTPGPTS